jgi:hypothetical protein
MFMRPPLAGCERKYSLETSFKRQEAMALRAVFDERRFETGLDAGYSAFIDIGFFLFP